MDIKLVIPFKGSEFLQTQFSNRKIDHHGIDSALVPIGTVTATDRMHQLSCPLLSSQV
jgi:hypothetical protein